MGDSMEIKKNLSEDEHKEYLNIIRELKGCSSGHGSIEITTVDVRDVENENNKE